MNCDDDIFLFRAFDLLNPKVRQHPLLSVVAVQPDSALAEQVGGAG